MFSLALKMFLGNGIDPLPDSGESVNAFPKSLLQSGSPRLHNLTASGESSQFLHRFSHTQVVELEQFQRIIGRF
jgi:hypothetical protein